ncbi:MAG: porin [Caulobacteraceae bacterium]
MFKSTTARSKAGKLSSAGAAALLLAMAGGAHAQDVAEGLQAGTAATRTANLPPETTDQKLKRLQAQVEELQAALLDLKASSSSNFKDVRQAAANQPTETLSNGRPSFASADGRFSASLRGLMQLDAANYFQPTPGPVTTDLRRGATATDTARIRDLNSGTNFRRGRIGVEGKVFGDFDYNVLLEFGGAGAEDAARIQELWLQYSGWKPFKFKIGAFIPFQGLEDSISTNGQPFLERPAPSDATRGLAGADTRVGAQVWVQGDRYLASVAVTGASVSTINSTGTSTAQAFDEQLGVVGRLAGTPFKGQDWLVHVGANGSYLLRTPDVGGPDVVTPRYTAQFRERAELRVDGTRLVDTGAIEANHAYTAGLELAAQKKNFFIQGEAWKFGVKRRASTLSDPQFFGWYVEGSWVLTGEPRRYNVTTATFDPPTVAKPFSLKEGNWGALELAARYSSLDLNYHAGAAGTPTPADGIRGGDLSIWTVGLNWYLNQAVRFMFHVQDVEVDRPSPNPITFQTPVGAQIGQHYQVLSVRSQVAF